MIVKRLLQAGADVTALDQDVICVAAGKPDLDGLRCVLDALGDIRLNSQTFLSAIVALLHDNLQLLLDRGADPNYDDGQPLESAVNNPDASSVVVLAMIDMLVKAGADVHAAQGKALRAAIRYGKVESVQRLLYHGASLQAVLNDDPQDAIVAVAARGDVAIIEVLLDAGIPLDSAASSTILAEAAEHKRIAVIELFERRGASPVSTDSARLVAAAGQGDLQQVNVVLKRDLNPVVLHGTALRAAVQSHHELVVATLLEHGQRVGPAPAETRALRQYCFIHAADSGLMSIIRMLVDHIAFDAAALMEMLHILLRAGSPAVKLLLDRYAGAPLSAGDLKLLSNRLPLEDPGRDVLRPYYLALQHQLRS